MTVPCCLSAPRSTCPANLAATSTLEMHKKKGMPLGWSQARKTGLRRKSYRETGEQNLVDLQHRKEPQPNLTQKESVSEWLITIQVLRLPGRCEAHEKRSSLSRMKGHCHFLVTLPLGITNKSYQEVWAEKTVLSLQSSVLPHKARRWHSISCKACSGRFVWTWVMSRLRRVHQFPAVLFWDPVQYRKNTPR